MVEWWSGMALPLQVFYAIALVALAVTLLQTLLALLGMGLEGVFEFFHVDVGGGDASGLGLFSSHTVSAFFLGFGWGGVLSLKGGLPVALATLIGAAAGLFLMFAMYFLLRGLLRLQSSGNLEYSTAVGEVATVYVTVPGGNKDGGGQVQVMVQGQLITAGARKVSQGAVGPGDKVRITGMDGPTSFIVEPVSPESAPLQP
jgi:membrane protein implicated in regulation of membrane protease activity